MQPIRQFAHRIYTSRILRDSSAMMVSSFLTTGISLTQSVLMARILGAHNYGLIIIAIALVTSIIQFLDIRTREGLIRFMGVALTQDDKQRAMTFFHVGLAVDTLLMVLTFISVLIVMPLIASLQKESESVRELAAIYMFSVPFITLQNSFMALQMVFKRFRVFSVITVTNSLILACILITLAQRGVEAAMYGYTITASIVFTIWIVSGTRLLYQNFDSFKGSNYRQVWAEFWPFAFHTSLTASLKTLVDQMDILFLGMIRPSTEVSYLKIAFSASALLSKLIMPVRTVIYPALNERFAKQNREQIIHLLKNYVFFTAAISSAGAAGLIILAPVLVKLTYGKEYLDAVPIIQILAIYAIFTGILTWRRPAILAFNRPRLLSQLVFAGIIFKIMLMVPLVMLYGVKGLALSLLLLTIPLVLMDIFYTLPQLGLWSPWPKKEERPVETQA